MQSNIVAITVGIKYAKSFRISDISGDIADHVLYNNVSPFGRKVFPKLQETPSREKILINSDTDEYFRVNTDDIIFEIAVNNNFEEKFNWVVKDVFGYLEGLFNKFKIANIRRLGIIYSHKISKSKKFVEFVSSLTNGCVNEANKVNVSFSEKNMAPEALIRQKVNDYQNSIFNFIETENGLIAQLDYQYYYEPMIEDLRDCFTGRVLKESKNFLENSYYSWMQQYAKEN